MKFDFNPSTCRLAGWFALCLGLNSILLYVAAGVVNVPSQSPLADPNFVIRELNDPTIRFGTELPPGTVTPINMLNGGEPIQLGGLIAVALIAIVGMLFLALRESKAMMGKIALGLWPLLPVTTVLPPLTDILFSGCSLRAGAQPLIDGSHRLRVVVAYIGLYCERHDCYEAYQAVATALLIIVAVSYAMAFVADIVSAKLLQRKSK